MLNSSPGLSWATSPRSARKGCPMAHPMPLLVAILFFAISTLASAETLYVEGPSGGPGGHAFSDLYPGARIVEVRVRAGAYIDGVGLVYQVGSKRVEGPWHGGKGGNLSSFKLQENEWITAIGGRSGQYVDSFQIQTNLNRKQRWGGKGGSHRYYYKTPSGGRLAGLWGRSGRFVDAIGPAFSAQGNRVSTGSLDGFAQPSTGGAAIGGGEAEYSGMDGKADSVSRLDFPQPASRSGSNDWMRELAEQLGGIVRELSGSSTAFRRFEQKERGACGEELYCRIWFRQGAIAYVVKGK